MRIVMVLVVLLAGCMMTPAEIRQSEERNTVALPGKLPAVALCVTRGFDEEIHTQNDLRMDASTGSAEMIANASAAQGFALAAGNYGGGPMYVVDFKAVDVGTEVTYYIRSDNFQRVAMRRRVSDIVSGCR